MASPAMATPTPSPQGVISAPPGYVVDLENPKRTQDKTAYVVITIGLIACTLCLAMRIFITARIARAFGLEDGKRLGYHKI